MRFDFTCFYFVYHLGDWHCAYVLLYGPRILEVEDAPASGDATPATTESAPMETS